MLFLKLTMRENRLVEAVFQLRLEDGTIYELPGNIVPLTVTST